MIQIPFGTMLTLLTVGLWCLRSVVRRGQGGEEGGEQTQCEQSQVDGIHGRTVGWQKEHANTPFWRSPSSEKVEVSLRKKSRTTVSIVAHRTRSSSTVVDYSITIKAPQEMLPEIIERVWKATCSYCTNVRM